MVRFAAATRTPYVHYYQESDSVQTRWCRGQRTLDGFQCLCDSSISLKVDDTVYRSRIPQCRTKPDSSRVRHFASDNFTNDSSHQKGASTAS